MQSDSGAGNFESLLPRLGEYLLKEGFITPENLQKALDFQKEKQQTGKSILLGEALLSLNLIDPQALNQAITRQILDLHRALQTSNQLLEEQVYQRTIELEKRLDQIRTAAEITQAAISTFNEEGLLKRPVNLIVDRFGYYNASIYLLDESGKNVILADAAGPFHQTIREKSRTILVGSRSMVGWVAAYNQPRITGNVREEFFYRVDDLLAETQSEAALPIAAVDIPYAEPSADSMDALSEPVNRTRVLGVLDIQSREPEAFDADAVAVLQLIANHIAAVLQNHRLLDIAKKRYRETSNLYSISARLAFANTLSDIYTIIGHAIEVSPFPALFLINQGSEYVLHSYKQQTREDKLSESILLRQESEITGQPHIRRSMIDALLQPDIELLIIDTRQPSTYPQAILNLIAQLKSDLAALIPIWSSGQLIALMILGDIPIPPTAGQVLKSIPAAIQTLTEEENNPSILTQYLKLAKLAGAAIERVNVFQIDQRRSKLIRIINSVGRLISTCKTLSELYKKICEEIVQVYGEVDVFIAVYRPETQTILVPHTIYAGHDERGPQNDSMHSFPLGRGLISDVITKQQPLLLLETTTNHPADAVLFGDAFKSWLGVPMVYADELVGAIVVQDRFNEGKFGVEDQSLLLNLAGLVAGAIRNMRSLETVRIQMERERKLLEITKKIRAATDMRSIIQITASELRKTLNLNRARIEIDIDTALSSGIQDSSTTE